LEVIVDKLGSAWIEQRNADPAFWPRLGLTKEQVDAAVAKGDNR
jgi:hypothetical protein